MAEIFSKNSISGIANKDITADFALRLGEAVGKYILKTGSLAKKVIICRDTRLSGYMLESALCAGLCSVGMDAILVGVVPTYAMSALVTKYKADMGISVTATCLPAEYNGFRFFEKDGNEADEKTYCDVANFFDKSNGCENISPLKVGKVRKLHTALRDYVDNVKSRCTMGLSGMRIAIDCANGSGFECAKIIFAERGAHVEVMHNGPDGENINKDCGTGNLETLKNFVKSHRCDMAIALNGDASEAVLLDENGNEISLEAVKTKLSICEKEDVLTSCLKIGAILADSGKKLSEVEK